MCRKPINKSPYQSHVYSEKVAPWDIKVGWPCNWINCADVGQAPFVTAFRKVFLIEEETVVRVHVSADERYELYVDGKRIGRGSERGDKYNWFFETYDLDLSIGAHVIVARVWSLGCLKPVAQRSVHHGFIFSPEEEKYIRLLGTGTTEWQTIKLRGYEFTEPFIKGIGAVTTGANLIVTGENYPWGFEKGSCSGWKVASIQESGYSGSNVNIIDNVHVMRPAVLPEMIEKRVLTGRVLYAERLDTLQTETIPVNYSKNITSLCNEWSRLFRNESIKVDANTFFRVIIDLENYYCAYPVIVLSQGKGSIARISWAESLYLLEDGNYGSKGDRNETKDRVFNGLGDMFKTDGGSSRKYETLWWQSGRYIEVTVKTEENPLIIESFSLFETHYPLIFESSFNCEDARFNEIIPLLIRSLQMCAHEIYMDCPYYEQSMYVGDTRIESLITYVTTKDSRLPRKAIEMFRASTMNPTTMIKCAYPEDGGKIIPSFCIWWIGMVYDYALWRGNSSFVREMMPSVRAVAEQFLQNRNDEGLIMTPEGWNFFDWTQDINLGWSYGIPPSDKSGVCAMLNWQVVYVLQLVSELEKVIKEDDLAQRSKYISKRIYETLERKYWNETKGAFADDDKHQHFSQHTQCLAVLSNLLDDDKKNKIAKALTSDADMAKTSVYFSYYLFETFRELGLIDELMKEMNKWFDLKDKGYKTTPEIFGEGSRSDCHAWGAHPLYHYFATILGIRPASIGFNEVIIHPNIGQLKKVKGTLVHHNGNITVELNSGEKGMRVRIILPKNINGTFIYKDYNIQVFQGEQNFILK